MKNIAVVLSGGMGRRMKSDTPKQYRMIVGKPVLVHTLERLQQCSAVDGVLVVANPTWFPQILQWKRKYALSKLFDTASAGENRQLSIRNGLMAAEKFMDNDELSGVIIQDGVRPLTSAALLSQLIQSLQAASAVLPVIPITDTVYISHDGQSVDGLLDRDVLFAGQAPEAFRYWPYLELYRNTPLKTLCAMSGSCQLPYDQSWSVKMIPGERNNLKITYDVDLRICENFLQERGDIV